MLGFVEDFEVEVKWPADQKVCREGPIFAEGNNATFLSVYLR